MHVKTTELILHFMIHEAEYKEFNTANKSKVGLKQQMLLDEKDSLAVLAVSYYTDWSFFGSGWSLQRQLLIILKNRDWIKSKKNKVIL